MIVVDCRADIARLKKYVWGMHEEIASRATVRALNRAGTTMQNEGAQEVKTLEYGALQIRMLKGYFRLQKAHGRVLTVQINPKGGRIPLTFFSAVEWKAVGGGVSVSLGSKNIFIPHAFIRKRGARTAVFLRAYDYHGSLYHKVPFRSKRVVKGGHDLPIAELFARSIPEVILREHIDVTVVKIGERRFVEEFEAQLKYYSETLQHQLDTGNTFFWKKD